MIRLVAWPAFWLTVIGLAVVAVIEVDARLERRAFDREEAVAAAQYVARRSR